MKRRFNYKAAAWILFFLVIFEGIFIISKLVPRPRPKKVPPKAGVPCKGKIAIVIDDFGYNTNNLSLLKTFKQALTVSVLPNLDYSDLIAQDLGALGFEIILHLPLEPREKYRLEKDTILTSMDEGAIRKIINRALESVPFVRGVSNHMGSMATEDEKTMNIIFSELKRRRLYFLDSLVSTNSVCGRLAKKMGLAFVRRDIFLDNEQDVGYIKGQLNKLKARALDSGRAIGIGHDRKLTIEVLKEVMPKLEKEGFKFVVVSELVH